METEIVEKTAMNKVKKKKEQIKMDVSCDGKKLKYQSMELSMKP